MTAEEAPFWARYAGDVFFLVVFLVVLFFFKPDPPGEDSEDAEGAEEGPNPLESMLMTETHGEDNDEKNIQPEQGAELADKMKTDEPEKKIPG